MAALPPPALLAQLSKKLRRPSAAHLVPLLVSTTLGHGNTWAPHLYSHFVQHLPPSPPTPTTSPLPALDPIPRRKLWREMKEGLVKSSILVGVPKVIETLLSLRSVIEEGSRDYGFVREGLGREGWEGGEVESRGDEGLGKIYRDDIEPIWDAMGSDLKDVSTYNLVSGEFGEGLIEVVEWMSRNVTYGTFLTPHRTLEDSSASRDPLAFDPALLSVVTLSCLVPQRTHREILWHLRWVLFSCGNEAD
jgi:hypothetical protein